MNQKKKTKILLIIIIVLVLLILLAGGAYAYFATDIFRSDKELFFKYISQIGDPENGFINENLNKYFEKRKKEPFNNQGEFSLNISGSENENKYKNVNDFKIDFSGQVDEANNKVFQNISLNYSDDVNMQLNYKQVGSIYGIQNNDVGSKFISIDINQLNKLSQSNMTIDDYSKVYEKLKEFYNVELSKEQIENIGNTYKNLLNEELNNEWFSKVEDKNLVGYKLSLEGENLKNILVKLLESIRNDQNLLGKINEYLKIQTNSNKLTANDIDDIIEEIKDSRNLENKKIEIIVYKENSSVAKISLGIDDTTISIEKQANKSKQSFKIEVDEKNNQIFTINIKFEGLQSIQNIKENYELQFSVDDYSDIDDSHNGKNTSNKLTYKYNYKNDLNFTDSASIDNFTDENSIVLTNYDSEVVGNFIKSLSQRIVAINKRDMKKIGLEEYENPIIQYIPSMGTFTLGSDSISFANNEMSELEVNSFNNKFEMYQGTNLSPQTVKGLLSIISLNNENGEGHKIKEINFEGQEYEASEQNINFVKSDIDMSKNYRVDFEKDQETGIIYRVIINAR